MKQVEVDLAQFFGDATVKEKVEELWTKVFQSSSKVLHQAKKFGFSGIEIIPSPNIHEMLITLQLFTAVIEILVTNAEVAGLEYDQTRQLLNAKAQITTMEQLASALRAKNRQDFDAAVDALAKQAPF
jgi:hypothetical protein